MAIVKINGWSVTCLGDGSSTSITWDMRSLIENAGFYPAKPVGINEATTGGGPVVSSSSLAGTEVTVNFAAAPSGQFILSVQLEF